jgi:hypothetical protein
VRPELLERVRVVFLETERRSPPPLASFSASFRNDTLVLRNRS